MAESEKSYGSADERDWKQNEEGVFELQFNPEIVEHNVEILRERLEIIWTAPRRSRREGVKWDIWINVHPATGKILKEGKEGPIRLSAKVLNKTARVEDFYDEDNILTQNAKKNLVKSIDKLNEIQE